MNSGSHFDFISVKVFTWLAQLANLNHLLATFCKISEKMFLLCNIPTRFQNTIALKIDMFLQMLMSFCIWWRCSKGEMLIPCYESIIDGIMTAQNPKQETENNIGVGSNVKMVNWPPYIFFLSGNKKERCGGY